MQFLRGVSYKTIPDEAPAPSAGHTPGPWTFGFARTFWHVGGPTDVDATGGYICRLHNRGPAEANARLIAAAPTLLAALLKICEPITVAADADTVSACQDLHEIIREIAQEAIAEAIASRTAEVGK